MGLFGFFRKKDDKKTVESEYNFTIKYNVNPPSKVYEITDEEKMFIKELFTKSKSNNFEPYKFSFTRLSNGTINVDYDYHHKGGFVGKVKLQGKKKFLMYMKNLNNSVTINGELNECMAGIDCWILYIQKYLK